MRAQGHEGAANLLSRPLEDYGLIGNMISAALVARDGSIDWLCLPRFDSPACFAALLGNAEHGRWQIAPRAATGTLRCHRRYLPGTAVLETTFETDEGAVALTDFMPLTDDEAKVDVVRIVHGIRGEVAMSMELILRFNYGQAAPWVRRRDYGLSAVAGPDAVELHTAVSLHGENMKTVADFTVAAGQSIPFSLSYHPSHKAPHFVPDRAESLARTVSWWREWSKRCRFQSDNERWREAVARSLITLKLLTFKPTGGIVAAPTTSLPEALGGHRNWDYRYCWLRDSALTLYVLLNAGYREEAEAWRQWLLRAVAGSAEQLQIMYGVGGERWLWEHEVPWLPGYEASLPVRIGNGAVDQVQVDVYGEVMDTLHAARQADLSTLDESWRMQKVLLRRLEAVWNKPDKASGRCVERIGTSPIHGSCAGSPSTVRSRVSSVSGWRGRWSAGGRCATASMPTSAQTASAPRATASCSRMAAMPSTPRSCSFPRSASCPPMILAS